MLVRISEGYLFPYKVFVMDPTTTLQTLPEVQASQKEDKSESSTNESSVCNVRKQKENAEEPKVNNHHLSECRDIELLHKYYAMQQDLLQMQDYCLVRSILYSFIVYFSIATEIREGTGNEK